jgi:hypothetical protein
MAHRDQHTSGRGYGDATVPHLPDHDHSNNHPVSDQVSKRSIGNIEGKAAHKEHWERRASRHSDHRDHENPANVTRGHGKAREG